MHTATPARPRRRAARAALAAGVLAATLAGCEDPGALSLRHHGIIGGQPTDGWPAVGAYLIGGGQAGLCTGTLIAERTVLTAAHCAAGWDADRDDRFYLGSSAWSPDERLDVEDVAVHPDYDPEEHRADLAILVLDAIPGVAPVRRNAVPVDDGWIGTSLRVVGFGTTDTYDGDTMGDKYVTDVAVDALLHDLILHETEGHNTCAGDSGGPALVYQDEAWVLAGVTSFVYPAAPDQDACSGGGGGTRVDLYEDWIAPWLDLPPPEEEEWMPTDPDELRGCQCRYAAPAGGVRGAAALLPLGLGWWWRRRARGGPGELTPRRAPGASARRGSRRAAGDRTPARGAAG